MYKIKELASLFGISTQTLRYYEQEGLLTPCKRDEESGYRYYSDNEVNRLAEIMQLREFGFRVGQIKGFFNNEFNKQEKINELKRLIGLCNHQIMELECENNEFRTIHTKTTEGMNVLKRTMEMEEPITVLNVYGEMLEYAAKNHLELTDPKGVYITFYKDDKNVEEHMSLCVAVQKQMEGVTVAIGERSIAYAYYSGSLYEIEENIEKFRNAVIREGYVAKGNVVQRYLSPCNPVSYYVVVELEVEIG